MKSAVVIGTKRSGYAAALLLRAHDIAVRALSDQAPSPDEQARFDALGVPVLVQSDENVGLPDAVVISPGVPYDLPLLEQARARGVSVIGEVELASRYLQGPVIGITGSNGKTTTTALTGHLLRECGMPVQVGGNIGTAVTGLVETSKPRQWNVLELSSFQLESIANFHANIGACLNITPDHLDRHHTFEAYAAAKARVFENQTEEDHAILNHDDPECRRIAEQVRSQIHWFSSKGPVPRGTWLSDDTLLLNGAEFMTRDRIKLRGIHNVENVMAAALMAHLAGAPLHAIAKGLQSFPGVEHRIEFVRELDGVQYYNDSKATNVDAALKAVDAFDGRLWIILGGKHKGASYQPLVAALDAKGKAALLIGADCYEYAAAPIIAEAFNGSAVPVVRCGTMQRAIRYAREHAEPGDTVLLSPACASFDQFQSYEHRGQIFKQIVEELI